MAGAPGPDRRGRGRTRSTWPCWSPGCGPTAPEELFDASGALIPELAGLAPGGQRRMSANPHANGGVLLRDLDLPDFRDYAVAVPAPGAGTSEATRVLGEWLRDVISA